MGINLGVFKAGVRRGPGTDLTNDGEVLFAQLDALRSLDHHIVVIFDEFQRLSSCPGQPLSIIRSALMEPGKTKVSLFLTGSMRERLEFMLHSSNEPIWDQTHDVAIPDIDHESFLDYLELRFEASGKAVDEAAVEELMHLTKSHPKRTQHLAWMAWEKAQSGQVIGIDQVREAFEVLVEGVTPGVDFPTMLDQLMAGDESEMNCAKAILLVAAGHSAGSSKAARTYGLADASMTSRALGRMKDRGVVDGSGSKWKIVDPLFAEWLKRQDPALFSG